MAKILVIDDEKIIRDRLKKLLELDGHDAFVAEDGANGLEVFRREKPDIIFVDIKMPGMDGIEVLKRIRENSSKTEVIIITGHGGVETAIQALQQGAFDYITKPIEYDELEIDINKALAKQELERKLAEHVKSLEIANKRLKETQEQLIQSEKIAALGQLAAGVAHEINNPLTAITMNTAFLLDQIKDDEKKVRKLKTIEREADRAAAIVGSLLAFSRKSKGDKRETVRIDRVIDRFLEPLKHQLSLRNITAVCDLSGDLPMVKINVNQMEQVFLNLINNARDAMEEGGRITIRAKGRMSTDRIKEGRRMLLIEFSDTGQGIRPEDLQQLFMPFFTTKEAGKGVGLGLYVSRAIVADHGGEMGAESRPGEGTTFKIILPTEE